MKNLVVPLLFWILWNKSIGKAPVTLDRIEPPNVKRIRILVVRWQKGQSGRKTETTDVHVPDIEHRTVETHR